MTRGKNPEDQTARLPCWSTDTLRNVGVQHHLDTNGDPTEAGEKKHETIEICHRRSFEPSSSGMSGQQEMKGKCDNRVIG